MANLRMNLSEERKLYWLKKIKDSICLSVGLSLMEVVCDLGTFRMLKVVDLRKKS